MIEKNLNSHKDMNLTVVCFSGSILYHWATENLMIAEAVYEVHIPSASYNQSLIYLLQFWTCMNVVCCCHFFAMTHSGH